ncbi:MAG: restriction endonuclease subunit M, partial [Candidatus Heimdallarchaeota archaeon]|nr:restriction endonuclease subunit M [Candidatus Heimdallarchaeota archaeon]
MPLFQSSVLNKYLKDQDEGLVNEAYNRFTSYFHNPTIQQNIRESKEEQFQEGFLTELFVKVLGYVINPNPEFNLTTEFKNQTGAKKADGAILKDGVAIGVIELKSTKTKDLEAVRQQAFDYKANQANCTYVVTSNFEKLRFYINNAVEYEEFDLFRLTSEQFRVLHLCLSSSTILKDIPLHIKEESVLKDEQITKKLYVDYSVFKRELFDDLVNKNFEDPLFEGLGEKEIKKTLFQKSQKLLDRFLFVFFAEDRGLLPPNSITKIVDQWTQLRDLDAYVPLYDRYKKYFGYLNTGFKGKEHDIYAYNGGLFKQDEILDSLLIDDDLLFRHTLCLSKYDFDTDVDVNILGHIFEHSLNEIEEMEQNLSENDSVSKTSKRKKDGVFYTPKYITQYIVENTIGILCNQKRKELEIEEIEFDG